MEILKELSARKGKGENLGRDLRRLQHQVQIILNNWMDFYRVAVGNYAHETQPVSKMSFASSNRNQPGSEVKVTERKVCSEKQKKKVALSPHPANSTLLNSSMGDPVHGHSCRSSSVCISERPLCLLQGSNVPMGSGCQAPHGRPGQPLHCTP